jgi:hypothetical protein
MTSIWVPVIAALGASGLTGAIGFGALAWQQRRIDRSAQAAAQTQAHRLLIEHSLSFTMLANTLRQTAEVRAGLSDGLEAALGIRRPLDPLVLYDRLAAVFGPVNTAWTTIKVSGALETVQLADHLVRACADLLEVAGEVGTARGRIRTKLRGPRWTIEQRNALQTAIELVMTERQTFIAHVRNEHATEAGWATRPRDHSLTS